ncbi:GNAT family N-acetyltransferase [Roseibium suaedae]|uniref:Protein N-acetyltransferase, RimJ/RimL family n=1 Tax=Roseibium suaedae TaxID=735517 RepID=A0A1M6ZL28_9HYPH|nr:GNAT family N-acetyltransferase [Roseibium suaedae]SHL31094.1 Protein N-acetyltransferase, RimJ/RimL family [Roseibium suaedae]
MAHPSLTTRRLVLRPLERRDAESIAMLGNRDFAIVRWLTGPSWPYEDGEAEAYVEKVLSGSQAETAAFAITLGGVFIGAIELTAPGDLDGEQSDCPTVGYWIGRSFHGFGYASEALQAVLDWAFEVQHCPAVAARAYEENAASRALLRKHGFAPAGKDVRFSRPLDRKVTSIVVRLDRAAYEAGRVAA